MSATQTINWFGYKDERYSALSLGTCSRLVCLMSCASRANCQAGLQPSSKVSYTRACLYCLCSHVCSHVILGASLSYFFHSACNASQYSMFCDNRVTSSSFIDTICTGLQTDMQPAAGAYSGGQSGVTPAPIDPPEMPGINRAGLLSLRYALVAHAIIHSLRA